MKWWKREHKLKIISLLLGTTLWYFVVWGQPIEKVIEVPVTYNFYNPNYLIEIKPSKILIKISATRNSLRALSGSIFKINLDLTSYTPGTYQIRVPLEQLNFPSKIKIKEINPDYLTVIIHKLLIKKVPVNIAWKETYIKNKNFTLILIPSKVLIKGLKKDIQTINKVFTEPVDLLKLQLMKEMEVKIIYPSGVISIIPDKIKIIYKETTKKRV